MSTSVFKPIRQQHEMARIKTPPLIEKSIDVSRDVQKVRRMLFGPVDHEACRRMAEEHLTMHLTSKVSRWEFDFQKGAPLNTNSRYIWSIVTSPQDITCKRPSKRNDNNTYRKDVDESVHLYPDPLEDLILPTQKNVDLLANEESEQKTENMLISPMRSTKKQTNITDFMTVKKSNLINTLNKRPKEPSVSRPSKLPRTSQNSVS